MTLQAETSPPPGIQMRGRSFMALVLAPELPLAAWFAGLDAHLRGAAAPSMDRPAIVDLTVAETEGREAVLILLDGLEARGFRLIALEGASPPILAGTRWEGLPAQLPGRELNEVSAARLSSAPARAPAAAPPSSLLIEGPVRSGQSVVFEDGDVTVVGAVASGAEVIAGGSLHVYGALRGRAIAGVRRGADARIFCSRLEAEMVAIDRLYRTAEHWGARLHGRSVQVRCDRGALRLAALD